MEELLTWGAELLRALGRLAQNPFYYISILIIVLQIRRQIKLERKLFHTRLHSLLGETWRVWLAGLAAGAAASVLLVLLGANLPAGAVWYLWAIALLLMLIRVRYLCIAYAAGVLGILKAAAVWMPQLAEERSTAWLFEPLASMELASLLMLVGVLHLAEGLLVRWQGARLATPVFFESKRGKLVGGYLMQGFWPLPLFLLTPAGGDGSFALSWAPMLASGADTAGWGLAALPAMLGFSTYTLSRMPAAKAKANAGLLAGYGLVIMGAAVVAHYWSPFLLIASVLAIGLHEAMILYTSWQEEQAKPYFVHDDRGLFIQAVLPNSPAAAMGLQPGEVIHKVNQVPVRTKEQLHLAMQRNPAYCKLEVLNLEGHSKFAGHALYANEHHQLGILLAPDDKALYYLSTRPVSFLSYLRGKLSGVKENRQASA
ncbi:cell division topological determinant MinJ [Paenibacillus sp. J31TS4]|uniref:PDZ domain-containing protein n=1 Tax=Paenibacillus sp. J31TS4 TaxID=2807195 RepID=UPI001B246507|nr:PDZ domain-containing protein [Paenibacillus sp. J31TS4]GIP41013.1 cell division topological determinant MinJ [Paenibacillus sp. J31TS4]